MKERTLQILAALIEDFVESANPVASQRLLESREMKVSSATIRNEFAKLEEVGLIVSPHVSAGKVPTAKGYRFFVDELMELEQDKEERLVQSIFEKHIEEYRIARTKESLFDILRLVSQLSGNIAFATVNHDETLYIGLSNVLRSPEFIHEPENAARIVEIFEGRERFMNLLDQIDLNDGEVKIFIGKENLVEEISSCALIVTPYRTKSTSGHIGILGPMRMRYGFNRALIRNVLEMIS